MSRTKTTIPAAILAVLLADPVVAQQSGQASGHDHGSHAGGMTMQHHMAVAPGAERAPSTAGYMAAMARMMTDMPTITGDADRDFASQMIPHHQAAIDMARVQLANGRDAGMRKMAAEVIAAQEREIGELRAFLAR